MDLVIRGSEDRRSIAAILIDNGYTVTKKTRKKSGGKTSETYLEVLEPQS